MKTAKRNQNHTDTQDKLFVVNKFIMAKSAQDAIRKEKNIPVDNVYIDNEWKNNNMSKVIGFETK